MSGLPEGWEVTMLGELGAWSSGGTPNKKHPEYYGGDIPWVRTADLRDTEIHDVEGRITEAGLSSSSAKWFPAGSLLVAMYGATIGRTGILRLPATTNQACAALLADSHTKEIIPFLWKFFRFKLEDFRALGQGGAQPNISQTVIKATEIEIPPLAEQKRIVAKLDRLSARSGKAKTHLAEVQALATRAKQATLAAAFRGELTAKWRERNNASLEMATIEDVSRISSGYGFPKRFQGKPEGLLPFAKVKDISNAALENAGRLEGAANYVDPVDLETLRAKPVPEGATVFAKIGEAIRLNRRAITAQATILDNNCMALTPDTDVIQPAFLYFFMNTVDLAPFSVATTVPSVRRGDVGSLELKLPSLPEQTEIVRRIETAFAKIDRMVEEASRAADLLDRLEQQLLSKAFRGELVPQDPNDEPASALLARIREARANAPKPKRRRKTAKA